jgi:hypothetical protein
MIYNCFKAILNCRKPLKDTKSANNWLDNCPVSTTPLNAKAPETL